MRHGDYTGLSKYYIHRPSYSKKVITAILKYIDFDKKNDFRVAEIGAGTGKLTKVLLEIGLKAVAVEPNPEMRKEGKEYTKGFEIEWIEGSGEKTNLEGDYYDWIVMASSFHWTDSKKSLPEFHRILREEGYFTAIWNPRDIAASPFHQEIEKIIYETVPGLKRVSSGNKEHTRDWEEIITSTGHFEDTLFIESRYEERMTKERYMGIWKSVNDIRVQAGEELFKQILEQIEEKIKDMEEIVVPYRVRSWTAKKKKTSVNL